jgi:hypothetical protein
MPRYVMPEAGSAIRQRAVEEMRNVLEAVACGSRLLAGSSCPVEARAIAAAMIDAVSSTTRAYPGAGSGTDEPAWCWPE